MGVDLNEERIGMTLAIVRRLSAEAEMRWERLSRSTRLAASVRGGM
jgi:hypothetical protein